MTSWEMPRDRLDVERFYRTFRALATAEANRNADPWADLPEPVDMRHLDILKKMVSREPEHRPEVRAYLRECVRLTREPPAAAEILTFPIAKKG